MRYRWMVRFGLCVGAWMLAAVPAMAQPVIQSPSAAPSPAAVYLAMGAMVMLGMITVCHPSRRTDWRPLPYREADAS